MTTMIENTKTLARQVTSNVAKKYNNAKPVVANWYESLKTGSSNLMARIANSNAIKSINAFRKQPIAIMKANPKTTAAVASVAAVGASALLYKLVTKNATPKAAPANLPQNPAQGTGLAEAGDEKEQEKEPEVIIDTAGEAEVTVDTPIVKSFQDLAGHELVFEINEARTEAAAKFKKSSDINGNDVKINGGMAKEINLLATCTETQRAEGQKALNTLTAEVKKYTENRQSGKAMTLLADGTEKTIIETTREFSTTLACDAQKAISSKRNQVLNENSFNYVGTKIQTAKRELQPTKKTKLGVQ